MQVKYSSMIFLIQNLTLSCSSFSLPLFLPFIFFLPLLIFAVFLLCIRLNLIFVSILRMRYWFKDSCLASILEKQLTHSFLNIASVPFSHPLLSELYCSYWENVLQWKTAQLRIGLGKLYLIVNVSDFVGHVVLWQPLDAVTVLWKQPQTWCKQWAWLLPVKLEAGQDHHLSTPGFEHTLLGCEILVFHCFWAILQTLQTINDWQQCKEHFP